jgi:hypothetical protein
VLLQQISVLFVVDRVGQFLLGLIGLLVIAALPEQLNDLVLGDLHCDLSFVGVESILRRRRAVASSLV